MTLDEAIEHAKELASTCDDRQCAADHAQLAEWLRQARGADKAARWCTEKIRKLEAENDKLRWKLEILKAHGIEIVDAVAGGYEIYSDDHKEAERLKAENAKLREYVTAVANGTYATEMFDCGGCRFFAQCYNDEPKEHKGRGCQWRLWARELGIEVQQ